MCPGQVGKALAEENSLVTFQFFQKTPKDDLIWGNGRHDFWKINYKNSIPEAGDLATP